MGSWETFLSAETQILTLTLNRPKNGNSLSLAATEELLKILSENSSCRGLVVTAKGSLFCAGGDLKDYARLKARDEGLQVNSRIADLLHQFSSSPLPKVAIVQGDCFGGGVEFVSAFDCLLARPQVLFGFWQRRIALSFGWGGFERLSLRMSSHNLRKSYLEGKSFAAIEAQYLGLVDELVSEQNEMERARAWIDQVSKWDQVTLSAAHSITSDNERNLFESLWLNSAHQKSLLKF